MLGSGLVRVYISWMSFFRNCFDYIFWLLRIVVAVVYLIVVRCS